MHLVELDSDHPGFRDLEYRARRDAIARLAAEYPGTGPVPDAPYSAAEHGVWRRVSARLERLSARHAAPELTRLARAFPLDPLRIPQLAALNRDLAPRTGFRMRPVAGLVAARFFLEALGRGVFLSTQYMRHASRPFYTPEPDVIHELVGHAATLADPDIARLNRRFGVAARHAGPERLTQLERVYWYVLEFGLVAAASGVRAFGAGLLSSCTELAQIDAGPELLPWDLERMAATPFDPSDLQPALFVAPSVPRLLAETHAWLEA